MIICPVMSCYVLLSPKSALFSGAKLGKTKYIKIKNLTYTLTYISKDMVSVCHQIGGLVGLQGSGDGALRSARHQIGGLVWLQGCGMVLYDLPAIRSVWFLVGLQGCGMVLYDLPAIRSVAWCGLQGSGMVFYDLPAIRSVAWWGCKVVGWCSTICPPSGRWPGVAARLWDGALRSARHQIGGPGGLQGCGGSRSFV